MTDNLSISYSPDAAQCCKDKDAKILQLEKYVATLEKALNAVSLAHTPLAQTAAEAPLEQQLLHAAEKVRIMQALLNARASK